MARMYIENIPFINIDITFKLNSSSLNTALKDYVYVLKGR